MTRGPGAAALLLPGMACLCAGWLCAPLLPRDWHLTHMHGLVAGAVLFHVAFVRSATVHRRRVAESPGPAAGVRALLTSALARGIVFLGVLAVLLGIVFGLYRDIDPRWHLVTFIAWGVAEELLARLPPPGAPDAPRAPAA